MSRSRRNLRRRLLAGLAPFALAVGVVPLLAPTCGGTGGVQTFARSSLIIPMDLCYQNQSDDSGPYTPHLCSAQAADPGNVMRAYGLVYQLVRNNIAVYWTIAPNKTALTAADFTIQYDAGVPVFLYDWNTGAVGTGQPAGSSHSITYIGGPFVVDGSDFARASAVLQTYRSLYGAVNVHVSNVAFKANVAKTMAGGWSAGGTVPPKLALLDIGSTGTGAGTKNSEVVIRGYLQQAGLDFAGAAGTATGTHGQIYDRLLMEDFWPDASGTPGSSRLFRNGYQILWVPHWVAPGSCADCTSTSCSCANRYTAAQVDAALRVIGAFSAAGGDVFAECAGLGSFEGVFSSTPPSTATYSTTYRDGADDGSTHFQTPAPSGFWINKTITGAYIHPGNFSSPLLQLGDFPFVPESGAIRNYQAPSYKAETVQLISDGTSAPSAYDVFTFVPGTASHGTVVYLGGHSYSGTDGAFQLAGSRLVLNTLFNLGAGCVSSGVACSTGDLGACAVGTMQCDAATGLPMCRRTTGPSAEICDGVDNDCNGLVDDGLDTGCYDGPAATRNVGICHDGVRACVRNADGTYAMSACTGQVLPAGEVCNGLDDDCNGHVDDSPLAAPGTAPLTQACYTGPSTSLDPTTGYPRGICKAGLQTCANGVWGACPVCPTTAWQDPASFPGCEILPQTESCGTDGQGNQVDMNCNGIVADGCGCTPGTTQACYRGPSGTLGVGACHAGTQTCQADASWGACSGDRLPGALDCTKPPANPPADDNCNGVADYLEPGCNLCPPAGDPALDCYDGPSGTAGQGQCQAGTRTCANGVLGDTCNGEILPSPEVCDGQDNDCDGVPDDGASCGAGLSCVNGTCVPAACGVEQPCPEGFECGGGACVLAPCGTGGPCAAGAACRFGLCTDPCEGVVCGGGTVCASGTCTAGGCYDTGCPSGQICRNGACETDACVGVAGDSCPSGTFCREGDCVQACVFRTCPSGQRCGVDGFCVDDPCASVTCGADQLCVNGACVTNRCLGVVCGAGLVCDDGACVDDPCRGIRCPAGVCVAGQCYATSSLTGGGETPPPAADGSKGCGCGSGAGAASTGLLLLAFLPLARRRRGGSGRLAGVALLAGAVALGGTACKKESDPFDPSQCEETCGEQRCVDVTADPVHCAACGHACGSGEICVESVCGPAAAVAPYAASSSPGSGAKGAITHVTLTGERFQAGAELRVIAPAGTQSYPATVTDAGHLSADLDFTTSPTTRVSLRVVNPDRVISNALPFDVVTPTPVLTSMTPTSVPAGATATLTVSGTGFIASSVCHVSGPGTADQALQTTIGASLGCVFPSSGLAPGAWQLWVVNEGTLASNALDFALAGSGTAHLDALSPSAAASGDVITLLVTGTGFDAASKITFDGVEQTTSFQDSSHLLGQSVTMPSCADSCPHAVSVTGADNSLTLTVSASAPRVDTMNVTPAPLFQDDTATLSFSGANLAGATGGTIQPPVGAAFAAPLSGTPTTSAAALAVNLATSCTTSPCPAGLYSAALTFGGGVTSASFQFRVLSNAAVLQSASPAGGAQGTAPVVTLTGSNLRGTSGTILFQGPGIATPRQIAASGADWVAPTTARGVVDLAGLDTGVYTLAIQNAGASPSNQVSFSVTPGMPAVTSVSPATVTRQDAPVLVTLTGTNFAKPDANGNAASQVMFSADGGVSWAPLTGSTVTVVSATTIQVQLDTRTAAPGIYNLAVWNPPGPQKSNTNVTFTVN